MDGVPGVTPFTPPLVVLFNYSCSSSPEIAAALSGATPPEPASSDGSTAASAAATSSGGAESGRRTTATEEALLALRRAALTGALEKTLPPGSTVTAGQAEAQKEEFWRGHVKVSGALFFFFFFLVSADLKEPLLSTSWRVCYREELRPILV